MAITHNPLPGIKIINLHAFVDERGFFLESYNEKALKEQYGIEARFVQDNHSYSLQNVIRGLHYQVEHAQGKLIRVLAGQVYDVVVDLRKSSPTFGQWMGITLSAQDLQAVWIPPGFAHGFLVLSPEAHFLYKTTDYYFPAGERCLLWNDKTLNIPWPLQGEPIVSSKDQLGKPLATADTFP